MSEPLKLTDGQIEAVLEYGVNIPGRRIFLHGDVDEDSISKAISGLYLLDTLSDEKVELFVSSYGGSLDDAFALHDVTRTIRCHVETVALGKCQSAAPMLVACGQKGARYATENTSFMLHDAKVSFDEDESAANVEAWAKTTQEAMDRYAKLLGRYSKKTPAFWRGLFKSKADRFFGADEALEWGLVDAIWSEKR